MAKPAADKKQEKQNAEKRILEVAAEVFTQKGYAATRTRDIAEASGYNVALIHYYFGSKDKLFEIVATNTLRDFDQIMEQIFHKDLPLHKKIHVFVEQYIEFFRANPYLPMFIVNESEKNPDKLAAIVQYRKNNVVMQKQLKELAEAGIIRPISIANFIMNLVSLTVFPFLGKKLLMREVDINEEEFQQMLEERKALVPQILINHLYLQPPV
ncbi:MAG: TetR family transcriptional regulator [Bacteroidota bacterium]